jgi:type II secretory pathway pseudopilin PulG
MASPTATPAPQAPAAALTGRLGSARGLSLVEVTVMLVVLLALAGALVPVVGDSVAGARQVRARNDLSQLAVALTNFQRDVGPFVFDGSRMREAQTVSSLKIVDVLMSDGDLPKVADVVPLETLPAGLLLDPSVGTGGSAVTGWVTSAATDRGDLHLRINGRGYPEGPSGTGHGWNGPYIGKPVTGDPWGHAYLINTGFLRGLPPRSGRCLTCAVYAISAGPNGLLETPFQQPLTNANVLGDDLAVRIQ